MTQTTIKIIEVLKKHEWISGEQLAKDLHISRTAIWKHINQLKKKGYQITAKPNLGYHLIKLPENLTVEEIKHQLKTKSIGKNIYHLPSVSSTNNYAKKLAKENEPEGTLIIADQQTGGRGRKQRTWFSPKKGLWFSLILRPKLAPNDAMQATMCAACAVTEGIMQQSQLYPTIKWPNDILINNKKVCGILTELAAEIDEITYLIVGIGINVNNALREELKKISTTLQLENKRGVDSIGLLSDILFSFEKLYTELKKGNSALIREKWMKYSSTIGSKVTIKTEKEMVTGTAIGIGKHGELIVKTKQGKKNIITGDISYLE